MKNKDIENRTRGPQACSSVPKLDHRVTPREYAEFSKISMPYGN